MTVISEMVFQDKAIDESSGVELSAKQNGIFYTHNDDRGDFRLFAFDTQGKTRAVHQLQAKSIQDWEDLSAFTLKGQPYLLLADTGDNKRRRKSLQLFITVEPTLAEKNVKAVSRIGFTFDIGSQDCEGVAVDVENDRILLATKNRKEPISSLHELPLAMTSPQKNLVAKKVADLGIKNISAMDLSPNGQQIVLLAYEKIYLIDRRAKQKWSDAIKSAGVQLVHTLPRGQWEAIAFSKDGKRLFVTKEKLPATCLELGIMP